MSILRVEEKGAATVEVAILTLVLIPMIIYAMFFCDMSLAGLKLVEASRYAAWEMTAFQISDWLKYDHSGNLEKARGIIEKEVNARWGDDLNSVTSQSDEYAKSEYGIFKRRVSNLSVTTFDGGDSSGGGAITVKVDGNGSPYIYDTPVDVETDDPSQSNSMGGSDGNEGGFGLGGIASNAMSIANKFSSKAHGYFGFNNEGFVSVTAETKLKFTRSAPIYNGEEMILGGIPAVKATQKLLVDAWDLKNGADADYGPREANARDKGSGREYQNQVKRMMFFGAVYQIDDFLGGFGDVLGDIGDFLELRNPFQPVVRSYAMTGRKNGKLVNPDVDFGDNRANPLGKAPSTFETNTYKDRNQEKESSYWKIYDRQSGEKGSYYMGCPKAQQTNQQKCWASSD